MRHSTVTIALAVALTVGLLATPALAVQDPAAVDHDTQEIIDAYNQNVDEMPNFIKNRFTNERVGMTLERDGATDVQYTAVTDGQARITDVDEGIVEPTIRVTTDEETIRDVANADDPRAAGVEAFESDSVQVEGVGVTNTVKVETVKLGYRIASALGFL